MASTLDSKVKALKNVQMKYYKEQEKFFKQVHELEIEFEKLAQPLYKKKYDIISGRVEPSADDNDEVQISRKPSEKNLPKMANDKKNGTGIPNFWLKAFQNSSLIAECVESYDEAVLKHLVDIRVTTRSEPMGFDLEFHFSPNQYFENSVLTKTYDMRCEADPKEPLSYEGPEIINCKGCKINWKKGMNVTIDTTKKKYNVKGMLKMVKKTFVADSFFNFFEPPTVPEDGKVVDEDTQSILDDDFEMGKFFRNQLVPNAVLYYTGEASETESEDEETTDDNDDEEEEDVVEETSEDEVRPPKNEAFGDA